MIRTPIQSSQIASIGYDAATKEMHIEFRGGKVYTYPGVEPGDHAALMGAESVGKHFGSAIRPKYKGTLLPKDKGGANG